ncbi:MAG: tRNA epoxyqueuosine(34) reductase QueG [Parvularculales bacterium]
MIAPSTLQARQSPRTRKHIEQMATACGLDAIGITHPTAIAGPGRRLEQFLESGRHGDMDWMERHQDRRASPATLWPDARSVIMLGMNYGPSDNPLAVLKKSGHGAISVYARGKDYHDVFKKRLKRLARDIHDEWHAQVKVFVDTAPLMEKPLAAAAGLGWQGKHTNLVSRDHGSWLFLGAILTNLALPDDTPHENHCGSCRACLDVCPTHAFPAPYQLDARRCISYLTIEHKGHIDSSLRPLMGNRIYGCDDCLAVCPWNRFARQTQEMAFHPRKELQAPLLEELVTLDDKTFRALFSGSPIKRIGRTRFVRNVLIAIGNSACRPLAARAESLIDDREPLVRAMAVWALARLDPSRHEVLKSRALPYEQDIYVRREWHRRRSDTL